MVVTRKALAYSKKKPVVNTRRSRKHHLSYIKAVPPQKVVKFNMGDYKFFEKGGYPFKISMSTMEPVQVRDLALEAVRQSIHKDLVKLFVKKNFFLRCNVYPHNILRNNRVFSGASKGERVQTGMRKSFGRPEGRACTLKKGQAIFTAHFLGKENISKIKSFFKKVKSKIPGKIKISLEEISN